MGDRITSNVRACIEDAGGRPAVAKHFGIRHWAVSKWWHSGRVPDRRVRKLVARANRRLREQRWRPQHIRPDIFGSK